MRFNIRDIMLLTVVAAVATGWVLDRFQMRRRLTAQEAELRRCRLELLVTRESAFAEGERAAIQRHADIETSLAQMKQLGQQMEDWRQEDDVRKAKIARRRAQEDQALEQSLRKLPLDKPPTQIVP